MLRNYLTVAIRNLLRNRIYTAINVLGLALGICVCILLGLYVNGELSFDRHHEYAESVYRVYQQRRSESGDILLSMTPGRLGPALVEGMPGVVSAVRILQGFGSEAIGTSRLQAYEGNFYYADASIFEVLTLPLVKGDPGSALRGADVVVLTEEMAMKYFGEENPVGQTLTLNSAKPMTVTGVMRNLPKTTILRFDFIASIETLGNRWGPNKWGSNNYYTFVRLAEGVSPDETQTLMVDMIKRLTGKPRDYYRLQPLTDIYLHSGRFMWEKGPRSDPAYLFILSGIAVLVLVVACINFVNLSIGLSTARTREVGVRKVLGAHSYQVRIQFWCEAFVLGGMGLLVGIVLTEFSLDPFNAMAGKDLAVPYSGWAPTGLLGLLLAIGLLSGFYPAVVLSRFRPVDVLRTRGSFGGRNLVGRTLVVLQFSLSVLFIVVASTMREQQNFLLSRDVGFDREFCVVVPLRRVESDRKSGFYEAYRNELRKLPGVMSVTAASQSFGQGGLTQYTSEDNEYGVLWIDYDYLKMMDVALMDGRRFARENSSDVSQSVLVNERLVQLWNLDDPIGTSLPFLSEGGAQIVGVIGDFHYQSLHHPVGPVVIRLISSPSRLNYILIKIRPDKVGVTLANIEERFERLAPRCPFAYTFLDADLERQYRSEQRWGAIIHSSAAIAILIAALGIFGLTKLAVSKRTREIGIRKAMGAVSADIVTLLTKDLVYLVVISNIIGLPVAYYVASSWLESFAYRIDMSVWLLLLGCGLTLAAALLAAGSEAVKASLANVVDGLRYE